MRKERRFTGALYKTTPQIFDKYQIRGFAGTYTIIGTTLEPLQSLDSGIG